MRANTVAKHLMTALAIALLVLASGWLPAQENCTYRKDSFGNYRSSDGEEVWRKDSLGNWRDREGEAVQGGCVGEFGV
jgi:hypothetical protein